MTPEVRKFILHQAHAGEDGIISMENLLDFFSSPLNIDITRRIDICSALWHLVSRKPVSYSVSSLGIPGRIRIWWKDTVLNKNLYIALTVVTYHFHQKYIQAFIYLKLSFLNEARSLTISAAFLHQCVLSSIEYIKDVCCSKGTKDEIMLRLSCCTEGFYATETPAQMETLIKRYVVSLLFDCVASLMYFLLSITLCYVVCF
jgi:hypothetical protein